MGEIVTGDSEAVRGGGVADCDGGVAVLGESFSADADLGDDGEDMVGVPGFGAALLNGVALLRADGVCSPATARAAEAGLGRGSDGAPRSASVAKK